LTMVAARMLRFGAAGRRLTVLPTRTETRPVEIITVKDRTPNPIASLFIKELRALAKPLAKRRELNGQTRGCVRNGMKEKSAFGPKLPYQRRRPMSEVGGRTDSTPRLYPSLSGRGPKRRSRHNNAGLMTFFTAFLSRGDVFGDERRIVADARKQCG